MKTRAKLKGLKEEGVIDLRRFMRAIGALGTKIDRKTRNIIAREANAIQEAEERDNGNVRQALNSVSEGAGANFGFTGVGPYPGRGRGRGRPRGRPPGQGRAPARQDCQHCQRNYARTYINVHLLRCPLLPENNTDDESDESNVVTEDIEEDDDNNSNDENSEEENDDIFNFESILANVTLLDASILNSSTFYPFNPEEDFVAPLPSPLRRSSRTTSQSTSEPEECAAPLRRSSRTASQSASVQHRHSRVRHALNSFSGGAGANFGFEPEECSAPLRRSSGTASQSSSKGSRQ